MHKICKTEDLVEYSGVCAILEGDREQQIALFYLPDSDKKLFVLGNWDPIGKANVISRGIVGNIGEELVVASPLYKQHFSLLTGACLEDKSVSVPVFDANIRDGYVFVSA